MRLTTPAAWWAKIVVPTMLATVMVSAQATPPPAQQPVFKKTINYRAMDLGVHNAKGVFVSNLTKDDFELYEDGVLQKIEVFYPVVGGRPQNAPLVSAPSRGTGGLILPPKKAVQSDTSGRVFVILIDDLSILATDSIQAREVLKKIRDHVIQDNDLVGIVSSGYSSVAVDLTYDYGHARFTEAIGKVMGSAMTKEDIVQANQTQEGPAGLRYMAHTAMSTARDILEKAAQVTDRRKAFIWVSCGYDFDPFKDSRLKYQQDLYNGPPKDGSGTASDPNLTSNGTPVSVAGDPNRDPFGRITNQFAEGDLVADMAELIRVANRSNMTIYTIDPRGLMAGPDIGGSVTLTSTEWSDFIHTQQNSLRALAENTGGIAIVNQNDILPGLERINNATSDYYMLGYNSTNQDPFKVKRKVEVRSKKTGLTLNYTTQYTLPRPKTGKS